MPVLVIVLMTLTFEGLLYGESLVDQSYPEFRRVDFGACDQATGWSRGIEIIGCYIGNVFLVIANTFLFLFGTAVFAFNIASFNVPGAPGWVRALLGGIIGFTVLWTIATVLFRGSKA